MQNFIGNFAGAVAPTLAGYLLGRTGRFSWPVLIAALVSLVGALSWVFVVGRIEPVDWEKKIRSRFQIDVAVAPNAIHP